MISEKIVVIDDEPRIIQSIKIAFPEYEIIDFNNGMEAIEYLKKPNDINIVLLDYMMPEMDGINVLSEIKRVNKTISVIMMTGYGSKDVILEALRNHADDYVEKPIQMPELKQKIDTVLKEKFYSSNLRKDKNNQVDRIKRFIERNSSNVNLEHIANELCLSPKYVSRLFNQKNDSSFREYKLKIKMDKAKSLLVKTHLDITEIAFELGYQNPESFMRIFKRMTQMTPSKYRKQQSQMKVKSQA